MLSLKSFIREGRVVGPFWVKLKPKGPKGHLLYTARRASCCRARERGAVDRERERNDVERERMRERERKRERERERERERDA